MKIALTLLLTFTSTFSMAATWVANSDHSEILFKVPYMEVSEVTGRFKSFKAQAEFAEDGKLQGPLRVSIQAASIDTGNGMRDGHLRGHDFFQTQVHPEITFVSKSISAVGEKQYRAQGDLVVRGISRPATVDFSMTDEHKDTWGYPNRFVKFTSSLRRKDYNITWNKTLEGQQFLVGDKVEFWGTFQMQPQREQTPNSKHMIPDSEYIRKRDQERQANQKEESSFMKKVRNLINGKKLDE